MVRKEMTRSAPVRSGGIAPSKSGSTLNMASNIKVVVRVRPPNDREMDQNNRIIIDVVDDKMLVFDPKEEHQPFFYHGIQQPNRNFLKRANKELKFVFDHVCGVEATNNDVFQQTTKDILTSLMEGYNCSVFVYGATGAGKTFTMIGNLQNPGITYLTMENLFYSIESFEKDRTFEIGVSYIEVYNENVYDLLKPSKTALQLREDSKYGVMIAGLTVSNIKTAQQLLNMLENGNKNRTQHPTDANAESSRSHAVFQVYLTMRYKATGQVRMVKLSMIDLAGSERAAATGCVGERFKEGANINRSLLSLGNCINKLADGSAYIPYRDSKLTRLLKDSLGGNCKTVMIANISPSSVSYEDTYNTLKYAARANKIQLSIKKNIVDCDMRTSQYVKLNEELKKKIKELEAKLSLSTVVQVTKEPDMAKEKGKRDWRKRIQDEETIHAAIESKLLKLMCRQRVLALRHRLRTRAFTHIADLAHRSSTEAMEQMCNEDIPRQERAAESYMKQSVSLDTEIMAVWTKWNEINRKLKDLCKQALHHHPDLEDFTKLIESQSKIRQLEARDNLRSKIAVIENDEINAFANYMSDMPNMLKKLYLTLKGYGKAPPALTEEYLELMRKAKSAKSISWIDKDRDQDVSDTHFDFINNLDLSKPTTTPDFGSYVKKEHTNETIDIITDSDELTDIENKDPELQPVKKRKGTPIKLANNDTIIIDDSLENFDASRTFSAKKVKKEIGDIAPEIENVNCIDPKDLNSTFVLANKFLENSKKTIKSEPALVKKGLSDRTNVMLRSLNSKPMSSKPTSAMVGKVAPMRRPISTTNVQANRPGFGSTISRDGTPMQRNVQVKRTGNVIDKSVGFKSVRARDRVQAHPYSRPQTNGQR